MPAWLNVRNAYALTFLLCATLLWWAADAHADFKVALVQPRLSEEAMIVNGNLELILSRKVEEALSKGIELPLIIEARLYRSRAWLWDERVATWSLRRVLQYHALSGQYLVSSGSTEDNFLSLSDALRHLGALTELRLPLSGAEIVDNGEYHLQLRAQLEIEALPAPLRPVAYTSPSWHLNSGWTAWNVIHPAK